MGPLQALAQAYDCRLRWTTALPRLGILGCERHLFDRGNLPAPDIREISSQSKDPHVLCVEVHGSTGGLEIIPLLAPCSYSRGSRLTKDLVLLGVHPLDIIIATLDLTSINGRLLRQDMEPQWSFKNSVEWMFWTHEDQKKLEADDA